MIAPDETAGDRRRGWRCPLNRSRSIADAASNGNIYGGDLDMDAKVEGDFTDDVPETGIAE